MLFKYIHTGPRSCMGLRKDPHIGQGLGGPAARHQNFNVTSPENIKAGTPTTTHQSSFIFTLGFH